MRSVGGFVAFHLVFIAAGLALLYALGFVTRLRQLPAAIGPALLAGIGAVMTVLIVLLVLGMPVRLPQFVGTAAVLTVGLLATGFLRGRRGRRDEPDPPARPTAPLDRWLVRVALAAIAAFFVFGFSAFTKLPTLGDDWMIWSHKALALWYFDGDLSQPIFTGEEPGPRHLHYPLIQPLMQSLFFRCVGEVQLQQFHAVLWVIFGAGIWTLVWLLRMRVLAVLAVMMPVVTLAVVPYGYRFVGLGYADVTVASFIAVGVVSLGLWLDEGRARYALLGGVFLAAAAGVKNEGVVAAGVALVVAGAVMTVVHRQRAIDGLRAVPTWLGAAGIVALGVVPWSLWRSAHGIVPQDVAQPKQLVDPGYLDDRFDRIEPSFTAVFDNLANQGNYSWLVPCALVLVVTCVVRGPFRRQASFYLAVMVLMFLALVATYATGQSDLAWWVQTSADRTVMGTVFVSAAALAHLIGLLLADWGRSGRTRVAAADDALAEAQLPEVSAAKASTAG